MTTSDDKPAARITRVDGRDALAFVIIRPGSDDGVSIEAMAKGLSKPAAARVLRHVADLWDAEEGEDQPAPGEPPAPSVSPSAAATAAGREAAAALVRGVHSTNPEVRRRLVRRALHDTEARDGLGVPRPAGFDALLDYVAARLPDTEELPAHEKDHQ